MLFSLAASSRFFNYTTKDIISTSERRAFPCIFYFVHFFVQVLSWTLFKKNSSEWKEEMKNTNPQKQVQEENDESQSYILEQKKSTPLLLFSSSSTRFFPEYLFSSLYCFLKTGNSHWVYYSTSLCLNIWNLVQFINPFSRFLFFNKKFFHFSTLKMHF